jgi:hypothetical protein
MERRQIMEEKAVTKKANEADEKLKLEVAEELGLLEKVKQFGWKGLTAKETGRIGGIMTRRKRIMKEKSQQI